MSEHTEAPRKRYLISDGLVHTILVMFTAAIVTLAIFLISPEFLTPAKSILADSVSKIFTVGMWFLFGWLIRGMSE